MTFAEDIPLGLCACGCGQPTTIATYTNRRGGQVAGQPHRFLRGHNSRGSNPNRSTAPDYVVDEQTGCWVWQRCTTNGYGRVWNGDRVVVAHRWSYEREVGPIPRGHIIHHECRNRACVNPAHLRAIPDDEHRSLHGGKHAEIVRIVLDSGLPLDEVKRRLGVV